ncbi:MAG TPA: hypothetical protein DCM05_06210 [Elusimicrobia bacterium]|nr:hypothetical protein [Elusimicrobiota bacterium]
MKRLLSLILAVGVAALGYGMLAAQSDTGRGSKSKKAVAEDEFAEDEGGEEAPPEEQAPAKKKAGKPARGEDEAPAEANETEMVKNYLKGRLSQLKRNHIEQEAFGKKFNSDWQEFWKGLYDKRRDFEIRIAKQRLNHFELLSSLSPSAHSTAIRDYEQQQNNLIKAFEQEQQDALKKFFVGVDANIKKFSADQEKQRQEFLNQTLASWDKQKKVGKNKNDKDREEKDERGRSKKKDRYQYD